VASGDNGNTGATPDYPSTSKRVIGVGGTTLTKSTTATRGFTESAWSGAGSSGSTLEAKPSFQSVVPSAARIEGETPFDLGTRSMPRADRAR
jgi:subtilase family serine protease